MKKRFSPAIRRCLLTFVMALTAISMHAIPAKPGVTKTLTLTDGTTITARLVGDEFGHYWLGTDGKSYQSQEGTDLYQAIDLNEAQTKAHARRAAVNALRSKRMAPKKVGEVGNYTGKKKGIIILANFADNVKFDTNNNNALYQRIANEKNFSYGDFKGSMYDYFHAQSEGQFELEFDIVGPVTVSQSQSYYGSNDSQGNDKYPAKMVIEACKKADSEVNFADYDWDGDSEVDQVYVIYAGKGEADGGASTTIWPHEWQLSAASYYGDGSGALTLDGVKIDTYACGAELNGQTGSIAGIGTMCHEFSHCLGYPDFYDTDYSGGQGMGNWDLMDSGSYNGDGYQPAGYTSYERWVAGWKEPIELTKTTQVTGMKSLQEGGESYILYNKGNSNEYFLLENRQPTGWDASLPGKGLLILHVDYNQSAWSSNTPNDDPSHQRMTWIAADNKYQYTTYQGTKYYTEEGMANDPYPYDTNNTFSKESTPAAKLYNKNSDGTYYLDLAVNGITQNSDGTISFNLKAPSTVATPTFSPKAGAYTEAQEVTISCTTEGAAIHYTTDGSTPTSASALYTDPIRVETTTTIKAIAITDEEESDVATAKFTIRTASSGDVTKFRRVSSMSDMVSGLRYIIASPDKKTAAGAISSGKSKYLMPVDVTVDGDLITITDEVEVFTLEGSDTQYTFYNENSQCLYATGAKKLAYSNDSSNKAWTLAEKTSGVVMTYGDYGTMLYNSGSPRFTTYTSSPNTSMLYAYLYVEEDETPTPVLQDVTLSFSPTEVSLTLGESFTQPTLTITPEGAAIQVSYASSHPEVAEVDATTGEVTILDAGTATITASFAGNSSYNAAEDATYTITVTEPTGEETTDKYVLVTSTTQLSDGDVVIIVGTNTLNDETTYYALSTNQKKNNRGATVVTLNDDGSITANEVTQEITLEALESTGEKATDDDPVCYYLQVGNGYLTSASDYNNWLHTTTEADDNALTVIAINDESEADIEFQGSFDRNTIRFNSNTSNNLPLFSCYAWDNQDVNISGVRLYRKVTPVEPTILKGDANGDGQVTVSDVMLTVNHLVNNITEGFYFDNADVNEDGNITIADVMGIVKIVTHQ